MERWHADPQLSELIQRYYAGEAGLWSAIRAQIDTTIRARALADSSYHIRLRTRADGYEVIVERADSYVAEP